MLDGSGRLERLALVVAHNLKRAPLGLRHDGAWYHVGTPEDLQRVEAALAPGGEQVF